MVLSILIIITFTRNIKRREGFSLTNTVSTLRAKTDKVREATKEAVQQIIVSTVCPSETVGYIVGPGYNDSTVVIELITGTMGDITDDVNVYSKLLDESSKTGTTIYLTGGYKIKYTKTSSAVGKMEIKCDGSYRTKDDGEFVFGLTKRDRMVGEDDHPFVNKPWYKEDQYITIRKDDKGEDVNINYTEYFSKDILDSLGESTNDYSEVNIDNGSVFDNMYVVNKTAASSSAISQTIIDTV